MKLSFPSFLNTAIVQHTPHTLLNLTTKQCTLSCLLLHEKSLWCSFSPSNCHTRQLVQITFLCCWTVMRLSPVQSERKGATEILSLECRSVVPRLLSKFHKAFAKVQRRNSATVVCIQESETAPSDFGQVRSSIFLGLLRNSLVTVLRDLCNVQKGEELCGTVGVKLGYLFSLESITGK